MKTYKKLCIDNSTIKIYRQYEKKFQQFRYSYQITTPIGWMCNGGFGLDNSISHTTYESILTSAFQVLNLPKETIRQYKLQTILTEQNDN
jgi:hypothetical protein